MIKIENVEVNGLQASIRGMRNSWESWVNSDSFWYEIKDYNDCDPGEKFREYCIGPNDNALMKKLAKAGSEHAKYRRMISVWVDITAPLYFWKEFDTYKIGTVSNSCSTMHKIHSKEFVLDDFSHEHLDNENWKHEMELIVRWLNEARESYLETESKDHWWHMIQLLPSSYNQRRTIMMNYEVLSNIYHQRKNHKLDEWRKLCEWIKTLPYSELITLEENNA